MASTKKRNKKKVIKRRSRKADRTPNPPPHDERIKDIRVISLRNPDDTFSIEESVREALAKGYRLVAPASLSQPGFILLFLTEIEEVVPDARWLMQSDLGFGR